MRGARFKISGRMVGAALHQRSLTRINMLHSLCCQDLSTVSTAALVLLQFHHSNCCRQLATVGQPWHTRSFCSVRVCTAALAQPHHVSIWQCIMDRGHWCCFQSWKGA